MASDTTPLTPVDTLTQDVYPPKVGTPVQAADIAVVAQALLNLVWTAIYRYLALGRTLVGKGGLWSPTVVSADGVAMQTVALNTTAKIALDLMHGTKLRTIVVRVAPAAHASLPANMPILSLLKVDLTGSLVTSWSVTDTTGTAGAYSVAHDLTLDLGADESVDKTGNYYVLQFAQEHGTNSADGDIGQPRILRKQNSP